MRFRFRAIVGCGLAAAFYPGGATAVAQATAPRPMPGQIVINPDDPRWLRRYGDRPVFIAGPGEPEDFLYRGTRSADGTRAGDQGELIDKLVRHGGNCIYLQVVRTHGGDAADDRTHNPFVASDPARGLDEQILAQWEQWFAQMDRHGILIYFLFYDDGARIWNTGDQVGPEERAFFEAIVRRFKHHKHLIWIVGEESEERYSTARVQALAEVIRDADDHGHPIGNHHLSGTTFKAWRPGGALNHFGMQLTSGVDAAHSGAVVALRQAAGRYQVIYAESTATPTDPDGMRHFAWAVAMAGVMPMIYTMDIANTPPETLAQCRHLQHFFEAADFTTMAPHDELRSAATRYVLADPGRSFIAYSKDADAGRGLGVRALPAGNCDVSWLDCQTGETIHERHQTEAAGERVFSKPSRLGSEVAAWIHFPDVQHRPRRPGMPTAATPGSVRINQPPFIADQRVFTRRDTPVYIQMTLSDEDGPGPYRYTIVSQPQYGRLSGTDNDRTYTPRAGFAGQDSFTWRAHDGADESTIGTISIRVTGGAPAAQPK